MGVTENKDAVTVVISFQTPNAELMAICRLAYHVYGMLVVGFAHVDYL